MKSIPVLRWVTAAALIVSLPACQKKPEVQGGSAPSQPSSKAARKIVSAEPTSFDAITKHLDAGGDAYLYLSTESVLKAVFDNLATLGPGVIASCKVDDANKPKAAAAWNSLSKIVAESGLKEISGFGASSIAIAPGYYQTKWVTHHYPDKGNGLIWKLCGSTPNALDFASYLPENTALASSGNLKLSPIWDALNKEAANNPDLRQGLDLAMQKFQQGTGLDLPAVIASLGPNYSLLITLNENRPASFPAGADGTPISFPEPALAICIQVQDEVLINRIDEEMSKSPMVIKTDEPDLKVRTFNLPIPVGFLRPTVAWKKGLLMVATNDQLIRDMLDVKAGKKPGFAATNAEYQKVMTGMPATGCSFGYASPLFQKTVSRLNQAQMEQNQKLDPALKKLLQFIYSAQPKAVGSVVEETPEGWIGTSHQEFVK